MFTIILNNNKNNVTIAFKTYNISIRAINCKTEKIANLLIILIFIMYIN